MSALLPPEEEIHVWTAELNERPQADSDTAVLAPDELERAGRFAFAEHRLRFVNSRVILRRLLSNYLEIRPDEIRFEYTRNGKPFLRVVDLSFSISHSAGLFACAIAAYSLVGIDIEEMRSLSDAELIGRTLFTEHEWAAWKEIREPDRTAAFYRCWTRKEATVKASGEGLSRSLTSFSVPLLETEHLRLDSGIGQTALWWIWSFHPAQNFAGAVVYRGYQRRIVWRKISF
jgi:4'-phosphopantetheinyl transferase